MTPGILSHPDTRPVPGCLAHQDPGAESLSPALSTGRGDGHTFLRLALASLAGFIDLHWISGLCELNDPSREHILRKMQVCKWAGAEGGRRGAAAVHVGIAGWTVARTSLAYRSATKSSFTFKSVVIPLRL